MIKKQKQIKLRYTKDRVVLSDILPYEVPLHFSNRNFYEFIARKKIDYDPAECKLFYKRNNNIDKNLADSELDNIKFYNRILKILNGDSKDCITSIPFNFKIKHKEDSFRMLTIFHPCNQIKLIHFYKSYKELILYYSNISSFSIRKPYKVAKTFYYNDTIHESKISDDTSGPEESSNEYQNLRSFFVYKDYNHLYKFYESPRFHRCEKKYDKLAKLDISKCFDSIYTHSIQWALNGGKVLVKSDIGNHKTSFAGQFDKLMQELNYGETHGIVIGPEVSRIFAELILQSVDKNIELRLEEGKSPLKHKTEYEIFRYIDDYFIFYNDEDVKKRVVNELGIALGEHKLFFNRNKEEIYAKPIITQLSMVKNRIQEFFDARYDVVNLSIFDAKGAKNKKFKSSTNLIAEFKIIVKEFNMEYKDVAFYSLMLLEKKIAHIFKKIRDDSKSQSIQINICACKEIVINTLELVFFIYSGFSRVTSTIRLCQILREIFIFYHNKQAYSADFEMVKKIIYDNILMVLKKFKVSEHYQVETLYLLTILNQLGDDYMLEESLLYDYFNGNVKDGFNTLNHFAITSLLLCIKNNQKYNGIKSHIEKLIDSKFNNFINSKNIAKDTELTLLFFDILSSPYVTKDTKLKILTKYGIDAKQEQDVFIKNSEEGILNFTDWEFNFNKALDLKKGYDVY